MECNKDEAIRAKQIAQQKMRSGDFAGALKIAKRAQKLFPDVDNIYQVLTVCEVHCAAENKLHGLEMDWYRILQTEPFADVATIKKQYKKLALLLHPDKNKFPFSESAFKLVGEANQVLSDLSKRSIYDKKSGHLKRNVFTQQRPKEPNRSADGGNPVGQCGEDGFHHSDPVSKTKCSVNVSQQYRHEKKENKHFGEGSGNENLRRNKSAGPKPVSLKRCATNSGEKSEMKRRRNTVNCSR